MLLDFPAYCFANFELYYFWFSTDRVASARDRLRTCHVSL